MAKNKTKQKKVDDWESLEFYYDRILIIFKFYV